MTFQAALEELEVVFSKELLQLLPGARKDPITVLEKFKTERFRVLLDPKKGIWPRGINSAKISYDQLAHFVYPFVVFHKDNAIWDAALQYIIDEMRWLVKSKFNDAISEMSDDDFETFTRIHRLLHAAVHLINGARTLHKDAVPRAMRKAESFDLLALDCNIASDNVLIEQIREWMNRVKIVYWKENKNYRKSNHSAAPTVMHMKKTDPKALAAFIGKKTKDPELARYITESLANNTLDIKEVGRRLNIQM
jgi:uncharacterized UPF0160 family protein